MSEPATSRAIASLVFGILSFNGCPCIGGIIAVLLGAGEKSGVGRAGYILGWINVVLTGATLFAAAVVALVLAVADH